MMRRALPVAGLLLAWGLLLGAPSCPPPAPQPPPASCPACLEGQHCPSPAVGCVADPPPPCPELGVPWCHEAVPPATCGACQHQPAGEACPILAPPCPTGPPPSPCACPAGQHCEAGRCVADAPPSPSTGCSIDGEPGPEIPGYRPALGAEVNAAMTALRPDCEPGSRCVLPEGRQAWQARVVAELRRRGRCAGQHEPTTDEIAAATTATAPREGWHIFAGPDGGPGTVVWSPGASRPTYAAPDAPPAPPAAGCSPPAVPKVDRWGLAYRNRWWDSTPLFYGRATATWTGVPVTGYCEAIGIPDRLHCPARQEGDPERRACEGYGIGGYATAVPLWRCENGQPEVNPEQPFQARCDAGWIQVCSADGAVCGAQEVMP